MSETRAVKVDLFGGPLDGKTVEVAAGALEMRFPVLHATAGLRILVYEAKRAKRVTYGRGGHSLEYVFAGERPA